jgi:hypothetical protein
MSRMAVWEAPQRPVIIRIAQRYAAWLIALASRGGPCEIADSIFSLGVVDDPEIRGGR